MFPDSVPLEFPGCPRNARLCMSFLLESGSLGSADDLLAGPFENFSPLNNTVNPGDQVFCRSYRINSFFGVEALSGLVDYSAMGILQGLSYLTLKTCVSVYLILGGCFAESLFSFDFVLCTKFLIPKLPVVLGLKLKVLVA